MTSSGEATVLVVEDETFLRLVAADMLQESGYHVLEAEDATVALELLARHKVAVVFADINIPGFMNGLELAEAISEAYPHVSVIITSGRQWLGSDALPAATTFLPKPYRTAQLASLIGEKTGSPSNVILMQATPLQA